MSSALVSCSLRQASGRSTRRQDSLRSRDQLRGAQRADDVLLPRGQRALEVGFGHHDLRRASGRVL